MLPLLSLTALCLTAPPESTCHLYEISSDTTTCGQSNLDCRYASYAKAFEKGLKDGACADHDYTVANGTKSIKVPVIGTITVTTYTKAPVKPSDEPLGASSLVNATAGCAASDLNTVCRSFDHLQHDVQACAFKCIVSGTSCMQSCVQGLGFGGSCASCWVSLASCSKSKCWSSCLNPH